MIRMQCVASLLGRTLSLRVVRLSGQTHWFVPTRFGLHGHGTPCPYDIVLCVFGGRVGSG